MIIVDVEGSGTDYNAHSIVSIGAFDLDNPSRVFYEECRIFDGAHIMDEALLVNGFSKEEITDPNKKSEAEVVKAFVVWSEEVDDRTLAGQNVSYDRDMIKAALERAGEPFPFAYRTIDTHTLCYTHMVLRDIVPPYDKVKHRSALNLDAVLNYCGIPEEPRPHNALTGAQSHGEVISRLLYGKKLLPQFEEFDIPWTKSDGESA